MVHFAVIRFDGASGACQNLVTSLARGGCEYHSPRYSSYTYHILGLTLKPVSRIFRVFRVRIFHIFRVFRAFALWNLLKPLFL